MTNSLSYYNNFEGFTNLCSDKSDLKDVRGACRTQSLFVEFNQHNEKYKAYYTLRDFEKKGFISAYLIYMTSIDENDAALKLVGSQYHWKRLCSLKWFMEGHAALGHSGLLAWRDAMKARDETVAKKVLIELAQSGNVTAAKTLKDYTANPAKTKAKAKTIKEVAHGESDVVDFLQILDTLDKV